MRSLFRKSGGGDVARSYSCAAQCFVAGVLLGALILLAQGCPDKPSQSPPPKPPTVSMRTPEHLRVCADPNNLPFSNAREEGFENRIAHLIAADLGRTVRYFWLPQRRGFVRNSLNAGVCDVILGVPAGYDLVRTTQPYYRSSYVFVSRQPRPSFRRDRQCRSRALPS